MNKLKYVCVCVCTVNCSPKTNDIKVILLYWNVTAFNAAASTQHNNKQCKCPGTPAGDQPKVNHRCGTQKSAHQNSCTAHRKKSRATHLLAALDVIARHRLWRETATKIQSNWCSLEWETRSMTGKQQRITYKYVNKYSFECFSASNRHTYSRFVYDAFDVRFDVRAMCVYNMFVVVIFFSSTAAACIYLCTVCKKNDFTQFTDE